MTLFTKHNFKLFAFLFIWFGFYSLYLHCFALRKFSNTDSGFLGWASRFTNVDVYISLQDGHIRESYSNDFRIEMLEMVLWNAIQNSDWKAIQIRMLEVFKWN